MAGVKKRCVSPYENPMQISFRPCGTWTVFSLITQLLSQELCQLPQRSLLEQITPPNLEHFRFWFCHFLTVQSNQTRPRLRTRIDFVFSLIMLIPWKSAFFIPHPSDYHSWRGGKKKNGPRTAFSPRCAAVIQPPQSSVPLSLPSSHRGLHVLSVSAILRLFPLFFNNQDTSIHTHPLIDCHAGTN